MPDTTFLIFLFFMIVSIIGASVLAMIFSRLNGFEDTLNIHREEYSAIKHRLYTIESELYKLRRERFGIGTWSFSSETITTPAPQQEQEKPKEEESGENEQSSN